MENTNRFVGFKSGFVAITGAPNAGKSTLLNRMLGGKISITSKKPQTTRNRILGIVHRPSSQLVFIDLPGVHKAKDPFNVRIVDLALSSIGDADLILVIADVANPDPNSENFIAKKLKEQKKPIILALNKIDLIKKSALPAVMDKWAKTYSFRFPLNMEPRLKNSSKQWRLYCQKAHHSFLKMPSPIYRNALLPLK